MKKIFESFYQQIESLAVRYQNAKAVNDKESMEQIRAERNDIDTAIEAHGATFAWLYDFYEDARQRGNEHIDISECYDYRDEATLIKRFRECGIDAFTFSSGWSSAVESAWKFVKNGCTLMGIVEINSKCKTWDGDDYEKRHAYLFKVN